MPAHSNAALAAYPELTCPIVKSYIGVIPGLGGGNSGVIYCAGKDSAFTFLQNVLDEVMALFLPAISIWEVMKRKKDIGKSARFVRHG
mgnify:CR=1 FL=1